jgi:hypothetical protein
VLWSVSVISGPSAEAEQVHGLQAEHHRVAAVEQFGMGEDEAAVGLGP